MDSYNLPATHAALPMVAVMAAASVTRLSPSVLATATAASVAELVNKRSATIFSHILFPRYRFRAAAATCGQFSRSPAAKCARVIPRTVAGAATGYCWYSTRTQMSGAK